MQKLLIAALLCTFGTLTLAACPGREEFQAATGTAVDTPRPKRYDAPIDVTNGTNLDYEEDLVAGGQGNADMDMDDELDVSDMNFDEMTQGDMDME